MPRKTVRKGLLIHYEFCTGCHTCEIACKQEHGYPVGIGGINVNEVITEKSDRIRIDYMPFTTEFCDLCAARTKRGELPSCVKHCQAAIMWYGTPDELAKLAQDKPRSLIMLPR